MYGELSPFPLPIFSSQQLLSSPSTGFRAIILAQIISRFAMRFVFIHRGIDSPPSRRNWTVLCDSAVVGYFFSSP